MAIKIASDIGIFPVLVKATSFVTWEDLAAPKHADKMLVGMFLRYVDLALF